MDEKSYIVVRSVLDRKGMELEKRDISGHDMYHFACESLRKAVYEETRKLFKARKNDIFDHDGNIRTDSPYIKEWINEYSPYRWRIGDPKKRTTIIFEVVRRTH